MRDKKSVPLNLLAHDNIMVNGVVVVVCVCVCVGGGGGLH